MADNKKILIDIQANTNNFVKELNEVNRLLSTVASTFSTMSNKLEGGFADVASSSTSANRSLSAIESTIGKLVGEIQKLNSTSGSSSRAIDDLSSSTSRSTVSFNKAGNALDMFMKNMSPTQIQRSVDAVDHLNAAFNRLGGILPPIGRAFEWNLAYDLVQMPGRAIAAASQSVRQTVRETASLEGEIYDLEAFLGGPGGVELTEFAKSLGKTGTDEQLKTAGLQVLQNKILSVGQESTFTALQIAKATTEAAKAGVSIEELAGPTGTALDAINLLAQNTGETLENSATNLSKLQNLFENNLSKTQVAFGQTADTGKQFQIIVDGLATADMSASATASELTQALFNVGGSAQNLNMSFFETVSLVASMVPAFESAASAGTSLKYMFSALSGGRSVKAQGALKELGLMDEYGQTVFFDKKGFKGLDFMVNQLREVFSDESGMAVDVRNRLITDIFGQDALKAVSRLVSMTDEQTREMLEMSAQLSANAASGVQSAEEVAAIKNEGLEYDLEVLSGTMDSLAKTLAMPLLKPMSNFIQTFSAMGNAAYEVMTGAGTAEEIFTKFASSEVFQKSMLPAATSLLKMVTTYAEGLGVALTVITEQGWNMQTVGTAVAALLGTPVDEIETRAQSLATYFAHLYTSISNFLTELPNTLNMIGDGINYGFDKFMQAFDWLQTNWDTIIEGVKAFAAAWVVFQGLQIVSTVVSIASGLASLLTSLGGISGIIAGVTGAFSGLFSAISGFFVGLFPMLLAGPKALFFSAAWRAAFAKDIAALGGRILTAFLSPWTPIIIAVGSFVALFMNNINGLRDFIMERFGHIGTYVVQSVQMMGAAIGQAWEAIGKFFQEVGQMYFVDGFANMFKGVFQILEGAVVVIGGILKTIVGIFTLNGDLIKSGIGDVVTGVGTAVMGVLRTLMGFFQGTFTGIVELVNKILVAIGVDTIPAAAVSKFFEQGEEIHKELYDMGAKSALNYTQGVSEGIRKNSGMVYNAATGMMEEMNKQANDAIGVKSPSTDGIYLGQMFAQGIVTGLMSFSEKISATVEAIMSPMSDAEVVVPNIKVSGTPTAGGASALPDTIGPRADAVITSTPGPVASPVVGTPVPAGYTPGGARPASTSNFVEPKPLGFKLSGDYYSPGNMVPAQIADYVQNHDMQVLKNALAYSGDFYSRFGSEGVQNLDKILAGGFAYGSDLNSRGEVVASRYVSGSKENIYTRDPVETVLRRMGYGSLEEYQGSQDFANAQRLGSLLNAKGTGKYELDYRDVVTFNGSTPTFERKNVEDIPERLTPYVPTATRMQKTGITGVFSAVKTEDYNKEEDKSRFDIGNSTGKILTKFDTSLQQYTTSIVKSNKVTATASTGIKGVAKDLVTYNTGYGYKSTLLSDKQFNDSVKQIVDMGTVGAQYAIETMTKDVTEGGKVNYKNDPYGYAEQAARGDQTNYENMYVKPVTKTITTTIKRLLTPDEINARNPDQAYIPVTQIPQAATFESLPSLHGYSTDDFDVAKSAKGFQMAYGEKGIAQRGLTDFFENNAQAMDTLNNIGNRAATFLSMKRGKLTPEDVVLYKKYLAQDKADRQAYLQAAKVARDEMAATNADKSLTAEQKKTANAASMAKLNAVGEPMTTGYTDVYGVKVGSMSDYASGAYNVPEAMKQYTDPIIGSVNDAIFEAVANSEEFKKLPKEEQDRIIKAAQNMPLQSMALLNDALMDGVLDSDEVQNLWTYAGEDIATIRNMIAEGRGPSAADRNLAYTPFIDGIASFVRREDISGDMADSLFAGWDNLVANKFGGSGQSAWKAFSGGFSEGAAGLTVADLLQLDPATMQRMAEEAKTQGKDVGDNLMGGVEDAISIDETTKQLLLDMFGPNGYMVEFIRTVTKQGSPSKVWRDEVGVPLMQGIVAGLEQELPGVQAAFGKILTATEEVGGKKATYNVFERLGVTAASTFVEGFSGVGTTTPLSLLLQTELLKIVNVETPSPETLVLLDEFEKFGGAMGTAFNNGFGLIVRETDAETTGVGRHLSLVAQWAAGVMPGQFYSVGSAMVEGVTQGVADPTKYAGLKAAIEKLASDALKDAEAAIDKGSPSRLFADEIGSPIVEGIAMGITQNSSSVSTAIRKATTHAAMYHSSISPTALNGASSRSMIQNNSYTNNYNLGVTTNQSPQLVKRSYAVMKSFKGDL